MKSKLSTLGFVLILTALIISGCGPTTTQPTPMPPTPTPIVPTPTAKPPMPTDTPEEAAREWLGALLNLDGNTLSKRTCDTQQEAVQSGAIMLSAFAAFGQMLTGQREQADISDLRFVTISRSGDTAQVRVTGEIRTAVLAIAQTQEVDETWQMLQEGGKWKWCGEEASGVQANWGIAVTGVYQDVRFSLSPNYTLEAREGYRLVLVDLVIENMGNTVASFEDELVSTQILADKGYTYEAQIRHADGLLPPQFRILGLAVAEVPSVATGLRLEIELRSGKKITYDLSKQYQDPGYVFPTEQTDFRVYRIM